MILAEIQKHQPVIVDVLQSMPAISIDYAVLENAAGYKMKRIVVEPGASLSLERHQLALNIGLWFQARQQ